MKSYIIRILKFLLPLLVIFLLLEISIKEDTFSEYSEIHRKYFEFDEHFTKVETLVIGNSHSDNAISAQYSPTIFNLANQGQDLKYDLYLLELIEEKMDSVRFLVIALSYFSFNYSEDIIWPYRVKDYLDLPGNTKEKNPFNLKKVIYDNSSLMNYSLTPNKILQNKLKNKKSERDRGNMDSSLDSLGIDKDATKRAVRVHNTYFNQDTSITSRYIDRIIRIAESNQIMPVIIIPPYTQKYNISFDSIKKEEFYMNLDLLISKYNLNLFDYSKDPRFERNYDYFINSDHLNSYGAAIFTKILQNDINNLRK